MFGIWSFLRQFMYTKTIIVVDDDIDIRDWKEVVWAMTTRMDATRDTTLVDNTPIDYLDFASPVAGLGSKMGLDATNKWPGETTREWGRPIVMDADVKSARRCHVGRPRAVSLRVVAVDLKNEADSTAWLDLLDHYAHDPMGGGTGLSDYARAIWSMN